MVRHGLGAAATLGRMTYRLTPALLAAALLLAAARPALYAQTVTTVARDADVTDALTLSPDARTLFGSAYGTPDVSRVDLSDGSVTRHGRVSTSANGSAVGADGRLYVADDQGGRIYRYPLSGDSAEVFVRLPSPNGLFRLPGTDTLVVASYPNNSVSKVAPDGTVTPWTSGGELNGPAGIAQAADGRLYVANFEDGKVIRVLADGTQQLVGRFGGGTNVGFIAAAGDYLYGTLIGVDRIERMDPRTGRVEAFLGGAGGTRDGGPGEARFNGPNGITATPDGDTLYVSDFRTGNIRRITNLSRTSSSADTQSALPDARVVPNPATEACLLHLELPAAGPLGAVLRDAGGRRVAEVLALSWAPVGRQAHAIPLTGVAPGLYRIDVTFDGRPTASLPLIVR